MLLAVPETGPAVSLRRLELGDSSGLSESWLQQRLYDNPELLLGGLVDPAFAGLRSIAMELPLGDGGTGRWADLLCISPAGGVALVEVKLGRNAEARREVVAQALEYASALRRLSYAELEARVRRSGASRLAADGGLYEAAGGPSGGLDAEVFALQVQRHLVRGRILLMIAVDKVRSELASLMAGLQDQPALPFEIALLEVACHADERRHVLAPRLVEVQRAVERAVVRVEEGGKASIGLPSEAAAGRAAGLAEEEFYQLLVQAAPALPARLQSFVGDLAGLGVRPEINRGLTLRGEMRDGTPISLANVTTGGLAYVWPVTRAIIEAGRLAAVQRYLGRVADMISGEARVTGDPRNWTVKSAGKVPAVNALLEKSEAWRRAITELLEDEKGSAECRS